MKRRNIFTINILFIINLSIALIARSTSVFAAEGRSQARASTRDKETLLRPVLPTAVRNKRGRCCERNAHKCRNAFLPRVVYDLGSGVQPRTGARDFHGPCLLVHARVKARDNLPPRCVAQFSARVQQDLYMFPISTGTASLCKG